MNTKYKRWNVSKNSFDFLGVVRLKEETMLLFVLLVTRIRLYSKYVGNVMRKQMTNRILIKCRDRRTEHVRLA
jgi:hypothetical protein